MVTSVPVSTAAPWAPLAPAAAAALAIDDVAPRFRAQPTTPDELADLLRRAGEENLVVAPRGGGTQLALGNPPTGLDLVVETTALASVIEYEPADLTITVEAGLRFAELQRLLAEQGQLLPLDPPAPPEATIGGIVATNASGPLRLAFGTARDLVLGCRVANADGHLTRTGGRVVKNVAGYDLDKLYVGSLGTLGVLVELSFKLAPIPPAYGLVVGQLGDTATATACLQAVLHSTLSPLAIELLEPAAARQAGLPDGLSVVLRVGGYPRTVERQVRDLTALVHEHGGATVDASDDVWHSVRDLGLPAPGREVLVRGAAPLAESANLVGLLSRQLADYDPLVWAHAGNGVAYAAFALADGDDAVPLRTALADTRRQVTALGSNASFVVERCPARVKHGFDVWGEVGPSLRLMQALKTQLDPHATLNRGRYVGTI